LTIELKRRQTADAVRTATDGIWSSPNGRSIEKSRRASDRTHNEPLSVVAMRVCNKNDSAS